MSARAALLVALALNAATTNAGMLPGMLTVTLAHEDIARIRPDRGTSRTAFEKDWGQFEVLVPKERFSISAPNCRENVILRMPAVAPGAPNRERQMQWRWMIFRALHDIAVERTGAFDARLLPGPYMKTDGDGRPVLEYCNAYFSDEDASGRED